MPCSKLLTTDQSVYFIMSVFVLSSTPTVDMLQPPCAKRGGELRQQSSSVHTSTHPRTRNRSANCSAKQPLFNGMSCGSCRKRLESQGSSCQDVGSG